MTTTFPKKRQTDEQDNITRGAPSRSVRIAKQLAFFFFFFFFFIFVFFLGFFGGGLGTARETH